MQNGESVKDEWLRATCRAGFIVLLVGFLPERGLFFLALGAPFWILLELGRTESVEALNCETVESGQAL